MALQTAENATFAANRMAIVFSRLPIFPAISPTFSRTKYRHFWHGNQGDPEKVGDRNELVLSHLDKLEEPASLIALRRAVDARLPPVDLPEIILEIAARTGFAAAFTHISERASRATDLG